MSMAQMVLKLEIEFIDIIRRKIMSKKIIYITGCLGFIGQYVTRLLLESGHYIRGIDKVTYAANIKLLEEFNNYHNFVFERIDICDIK